MSLLASSVVIYPQEVSEMKLNYFLLCENFVIDDNGRASLINIFDGVSAEKLPIRPAKFGIAFSIAVTQDEARQSPFQLLIRVVNDKSDKTVLEIKGVGEGEATQGSLVSYIDLAGKVGIKNYGQYTIHLAINDTELATLPFAVNPKKKGGK